MSGRHLTLEELNAGLPHIESSPKDRGELRLIVRRPSERSGGVTLDGASREVLSEAQLDVTEGLVGDTWNRRGSTRTRDKSPHPGMQLNIMNARVIALLAGSDDRWPLAGDQLYLDLDLAGENLPPGTRLALGSAIIEVSAEPHTGCGKFSARFGVEQSGTIRVGDIVTKL
jgi:hypothetical protein